MPSTFCPVDDAYTSLNNGKLWTCEKCRWNNEARFNTCTNCFHSLSNRSNTTREESKEHPFERFVKPTPAVGKGNMYGRRHNGGEEVEPDHKHSNGPCSGTLDRASCAGPHETECSSRGRYDSTLREKHPQLEPRGVSIDAEAVRTWVYPINYPVREYQRQIVTEALFKNTLVSLPTGLGKTLIAAVVMYNFYRWFPEGKVVFLAPTKPLVAQQISACYDIMGIPEEHTAELQGSVAPERRQQLWEERRVFYCTPQSMANDIQKKRCDPGRFVCVVVDEAHRATGNYAYVPVIRAVAAATPHFRVLALSATPGSDLKTIQQVLVNLRIANIECRSEDDAEVAKHTHARQVEVVKCKLGSHIDSIRQGLVSVMQPLVSRMCGKRLLFTKDPMTLKAWTVIQSLHQFRREAHSNGIAHMAREVEGEMAVLIKVVHAKDTLVTHGAAGCLQKLGGMEEEVALRGFRSKAMKEVMQHSQWAGLMTLLRQTTKDMSGVSIKHPKLIKLKEVLREHFARHKAGGSSTRAIVFTQFRDSVEEITEFLSSEELLCVKPFIGQGRGRVGVTEGGGEDGGERESLGEALLPKQRLKGQTQKEQKAVVKAFFSGEYNCLVATCIAEEGLDIGEVDLIVSFDALNSPVRMVQRMGRTGRKRAGKVVVLVTEGSEETKLRNSNSKSKSIIKALQQRRDKFELFQEGSSMVPEGPRPHMVEQEMVIKEYHLSQVGGHMRKEGRRRGGGSGSGSCDSSGGVEAKRREDWRLTADEELTLREAYSNGEGEGPYIPNPVSGWRRAKSMWSVAKEWEILYDPDDMSRRLLMSELSDDEDSGGGSVLEASGPQGGKDRGGGGKCGLARGKSKYKDSSGASGRGRNMAVGIGYENKDKPGDEKDELFWSAQKRKGVKYDRKLVSCPDDRGALMTGKPKSSRRKGVETAKSGTGGVSGRVKVKGGAKVQNKADSVAPKACQEDVEGGNTTGGDPHSASREICDGVGKLQENPEREWADKGGVGIGVDECRRNRSVGSCEEVPEPSDDVQNTQINSGGQTQNETQTQTQIGSHPCGTETVGEKCIHSAADLQAGSSDAAQVGSSNTSDCGSSGSQGRWQCGCGCIVKAHRKACGMCGAFPSRESLYQSSPTPPSSPISTQVPCPASGPVSAPGPTPREREKCENERAVVQEKISQSSSLLLSQSNVDQYGIRWECGCGCRMKADRLVCSLCGEPKPLLAGTPCSSPDSSGRVVGDSVSATIASQRYGADNGDRESSDTIGKGDEQASAQHCNIASLCSRTNKKLAVEVEELSSDSTIQKVVSQGGNGVRCRSRSGDEGERATHGDENVHRRRNAKPPGESGQVPTARCERVDVAVPEECLEMDPFEVDGVCKSLNGEKSSCNNHNYNRGMSSNSWSEAISTGIDGKVLLGEEILNQKQSQSQSDDDDGLQEIFPSLRHFEADTTGVGGVTKHTSEVMAWDGGCSGLLQGLRTGTNEARSSNETAVIPQPISSPLISVPPTLGAPWSPPCKKIKGIKEDSSWASNLSSLALPDHEPTPNTALSGELWKRESHNTTMISGCKRLLKVVSTSDQQEGSSSSLLCDPSTVDSPLSSNTGPNSVVSIPRHCSEGKISGMKGMDESNPALFASVSVATSAVATCNAPKLAGGTDLVSRQGPKKGMFVDTQGAPEGDCHSTGTAPHDDKRGQRFTSGSFPPPHGSGPKPDEMSSDVKCKDNDCAALGQSCSDDDRYGTVGGVGGSAAKHLLKYPLLCPSYHHVCNSNIKSKEVQIEGEEAEIDSLLYHDAEMETATCTDASSGVGRPEEACSEGSCEFRSCRESAALVAREDAKEGNGCGEALDGGQDGGRKNNRVLSQQLEEEDKECSVCSNPLSCDGDPIILCDGLGCRMAVHASCYGVDNIPKEDWLCEPCVHALSAHGGDGIGSRSSSDPKLALNLLGLRPKCALCQHRGGALKQSECGQWAHVVCVLWTPELLTRGASVRPITLSTLDADRANLMCSICRGIGDAVVQCAHPPCLKAVHPFCAQRASLLLEEEGVGGGFELRCRMHSEVRRQELEEAEATAAASSGVSLTDLEGKGCKGQPLVSSCQDSNNCNQGGAAPGGLRERSKPHHYHGVEVDEPAEEKHMDRPTTPTSSKQKGARVQDEAGIICDDSGGGGPSPSPQIQRHGKQLIMAPPVSLPCPNSGSFSGGKRKNREVPQLPHSGSVPTGFGVEDGGGEESTLLDSPEGVCDEENLMTLSQAVTPTDKEKKPKQLRRLKKTGQMDVDRKCKGSNGLSFKGKKRHRTFGVETPSEQKVRMEKKQSSGGGGREGTKKQRALFDKKSYRRFIDAEAEVDGDSVSDDEEDELDQYYDSDDSFVNDGPLSYETDVSQQTQCSEDGDTPAEGGGQNAGGGAAVEACVEGKNGKRKKSKEVKRSMRDEKAMYLQLLDESPSQDLPPLLSRRLCRGARQTCDSNNSGTRPHNRKGRLSFISAVIRHARDGGNPLDIEGACNSRSEGKSPQSPLSWDGEVAGTEESPMLGSAMSVGIESQGGSPEPFSGVNGHSADTLYDSMYSQALMQASPPSDTTVSEVVVPVNSASLGEVNGKENQAPDTHKGKVADDSEVGEGGKLKTASVVVKEAMMGRTRSEVSAPPQPSHVTRCASGTKTDTERGTVAGQGTIKGGATAAHHPGQSSTGLVRQELLHNGQSSQPLPQPAGEGQGPGGCNKIPLKCAGGGGLTEEQRKKMEENRLKALARLKERQNAKSRTQNTGLGQQGNVATNQSERKRLEYSQAQQPPLAASQVNKGSVSLKARRLALPRRPAPPPRMEQAEISALTSFVGVVKEGSGIVNNNVAISLKGDQNQNRHGRQVVNVSQGSSKVHMPGEQISCPGLGQHRYTMGNTHDTTQGQDFALEQRGEQMHKNSGETRHERPGEVQFQGQSPRKKFKLKMVITDEDSGNDDTCSDGETMTKSVHGCHPGIGNPKPTTATVLAPVASHNPVSQSLASHAYSHIQPREVGGTQVCTRDTHPAPIQVTAFKGGPGNNSSAGRIGYLSSHVSHRAVPVSGVGVDRPMDMRSHRKVPLPSLSSRPLRLVLSERRAGLLTGLVSELRSFPGVEVHVTGLGGGEGEDVVVGVQCAVVVRSRRQFLSETRRPVRPGNSVGPLPGKLRAQLQRYGRLVVVVEGGEVRESEVGGPEREAVIEVSKIAGVSVMATEDYQGTAKFVLALAQEEEGKNLGFPREVSGPLLSQSQQKFLTFLLKAPSLSYPAGLFLLERFRGRSSKDLMSSSAQELQSAVPGMTKQQAAKLKRYLCPQPLPAHRPLPKG